MQENNLEKYPLSSLKTIKGSRHLVREKVLQILYAFYICETPIETLINNIFEREFNFDEFDGIEDLKEEDTANLEKEKIKSNSQNNYRNSNNTVEKKDKIYRPDEIIELEADIQILWRPDDILFGQNLVDYIIKNNEYIDNLIDTLVINWDKSRIAPVDRILIQIAIAEFIAFPEIPIKVSMDEVIDISKSYSTDRSSNFINGVLDTIYENLKSQNKIQKIGRGLKE